MSSALGERSTVHRRHLLRRRGCGGRRGATGESPLKREGADGNIFVLAQDLNYKYLGQQFHNAAFQTQWDRLENKTAPMRINYEKRREGPRAGGSLAR